MGSFHCMRVDMALCTTEAVSDPRAYCKSIFREVCLRVDSACLDPVEDSCACLKSEQRVDRYEISHEYTFFVDTGFRFLWAALAFSVL
jgi:hypothetical protein